MLRRTVMQKAGTAKITSSKNIRTATDQGPLRIFALKNTILFRAALFLHRIAF